MMWVYRSVGLAFEVGFYDPSGAWNVESAHTDGASAADRVHWLNGGQSHTEWLASSATDSPSERSLSRIARLT